MLRLINAYGFTVGYAWALLGAALLLAGLGLDIALHARDPLLLDQERVFELDNPGHMLAIVGLSNLVAGLFLGSYARWVAARGSRALSTAVLIVAVAVMAGLLAGLVRLDRSTEGHAASATATSEGARPASASHGSTEAVQAEQGHGFAVLPEHELALAVEESTFHEPPNPAPVTRENLRFAEEFLVKAREATEKYKDVSLAVRDGYFQVTQYLPIIGAHFANLRNEGSLDPARPAILLYEPDGAGGWALVGLAYTMPKGAGVDVPPETPFGGLVRWHYHTNLCFALGNVSLAQDASQCRGIFVAETSWLLHVWVWKDSPEGVFNHANSLLQ